MRWSLVVEVRCIQCQSLRAPCNNRNALPPSMNSNHMLLSIHIYCCRCCFGTHNSDTVPKALLVVKDTLSYFRRNGYHVWFGSFYSFITLQTANLRSSCRSHLSAFRLL